MGAPRKVFRIEETPGARLADDGAEASLRHAEIVQTQILQELAALRSAVAAPTSSVSRPDMSSELAGTATGRLTSELHLIADRLAGGDAGDSDDVAAVPLTRIANELLAVTDGTEQATQKILAAAEEIDQLANNLSAALKGKIEQGAAQDISDLVIRIFEACNFQDLTGQRIAKVMTTLKFLEHPAVGGDGRSTPPRDDAAQLLHGPRLDSDSGHITQAEIDALFDS